MIRLSHHWKWSLPAAAAAGLAVLAGLRAPPDPPSGWAQAQRLYAALDAPVDLTTHGRRLGDVLADLSRQTSWPITTDADARTMPVTLDVRGVPLRSVLELLGRQLPLPRQLDVGPHGMRLVVQPRHAPVVQFTTVCPLPPLGPQAAPGPTAEEADQHPARLFYPHAAVLTTDWRRMREADWQLDALESPELLDEGLAFVEPPSQRVLRRRLRRPVTLDLPAMTLSKFARRLSDEFDLPVHVVRGAARERRRLARLRCRELPLRDVLEVQLRPLGMTARVLYDVVLIESRDDWLPSDQFVVAMHDVSDVEVDGREAFKFWSPSGYVGLPRTPLLGDGQSLPGVICCRGTVEQHEQLQQLLDDVRRAHGLPPRRPAPAWRTAWSKVVHWKLDGASLSDVLRRLRRDLGALVVVDGDAALTPRVRLMELMNRPLEFSGDYRGPLEEVARRCLATAGLTIQRRQGRLPRICRVANSFLPDKK